MHLQPCVQHEWKKLVEEAQASIDEGYGLFDDEVIIQVQQYIEYLESKANA